MAGGQSSRFGSDKTDAVLKGVRLIDHVIKALLDQSAAQIVINGNARLKTTLPGYKVISDLGPHVSGPLAGIQAALQWADSMGQQRVVTVSVDTPFLPRTLLQRFSELPGAGLAASDGRAHPTCGVWPANLLSSLNAFLDEGHRTAAAWCDLCQAERVEFEIENGIDPFFNINTIDDLSYAESRMSV